ncbi:MAG: phosphoribosylglycinamide formyltransferase, partial [Planctomycetota bacterium]
AEYGARVWPVVEERLPDLVCLCGFVHLLPIPRPWRGKVLNIHPGLLPEFGGKGMYGGRVHAAVLRAGARVSGCTVHFADEEYDHGPVILRREVPVAAGDSVETLAARVFQAECEAYPEAIRLFAAGRLPLEGGNVEIRNEGGRR